MIIHRYHSENNEKNKTRNKRKIKQENPAGGEGHRKQGKYLLSIYSQTQLGLDRDSRSRISHKQQQQQQQQQQQHLERSGAPLADPHHCALRVQRGVALAAVEELGVARVHAQHHVQVLLDARYEELVGRAESA